jgi:3-methyl-2-oxobutanoate hydroxymethyltransferase
VPRFVKPYADLKTTIAAALGAYVQDVRAGSFPGAEHTYGMPESELARFESQLAEESQPGEFRTPLPKG